MASEVIEKIFKCINENRHFILEAGAGAGKTHALIETINYLQKNPNISFNKKQNIVCITFTNVAKNEILERLSSEKNIIVSTMHDFFWNFITQFQIELKKQLLLLIVKEKLEIEKKIENAIKLIQKPRSNTNVEKKQEELEYYLKRQDRFKEVNIEDMKIRYRNYRALHKGVISHKDVLEIAQNFLGNKVFLRLFLDTFTHVFIDEYQDTNEELMLKLLSTIKDGKNNKYFVIGLFGDKMQQIYSGVTLEIDNEEFGLERIEKLDNYRSCEEIILSNNILRNDGLNQECKNSNVVLDKIEFIYNLNEDKYLEKYEEIIIEEYTRLFLTHKEIAEKVGFKAISDIFSNEYPIDSNERLLKVEDEFIKYIINEVIYLIIEFRKGNYSKIIEKQNINVMKKSDLIALRNVMEEICAEGNESLKDTIINMNKINLVDIKKYEEIVNDYSQIDKAEFIDCLINVSLSEYSLLYTQIKENTGLQTLHGVKGDEFKKVIVNIKEGQPWTHYNFDEFLSEGTINKSSSSYKTHRLFYVACTRAKQSLIINYIATTNDEEYKQKIFIKVKEHFGSNITIREY